MREFENGHFRESYALLQACENSCDVSAKVYIALAYLIFVEEMGQGTRYERSLKGWELTEKAALTGSEDAIVTLASMYAVGDDELRFPPDLRTQQCLLDITDDDRLRIDKETFSPGSVTECLRSADSPLGKLERQPK